MTGLRHEAEEYLKMRRALGYKLDVTGWLVGQFAGHCDTAGITHVTNEVALGWAARPPDVTAWYRWLRLNAVRGFAVYLHALDPAHQVPPSDLLPCRQQRPTPCLLLSAAVAALMDATATMRPLLCAATYRALIGLVAVTGMRPGEAARLDVDDVDLTSGIIVVHGKGGKTRLNLLHPSTVAALADYARQRDQAFPWRTGQSFFVSTRGTRLSVKRIDKTFARLAARADLARPAPMGHPTPMSLRHSFAVTTLISWYADDVDIDANMPVLSTWLGHTDPASTYYYLQEGSGIASAGRSTRSLPG